MQGQHREGYVSVSFTSIPKDAYRRFKDLAEDRGYQFPRDLFGDAIRQLLADRKAGQKIVYHASRKGGIRRAMWLDEELVEGMKEAAEQDQVSQTEFFLTALKRWSDQEGFDVEM